MLKASVSTIKNGLSSYLEKVKKGQRVLITDHRKAVAVLEPVDSVRWPEEIRSRLESGEAKAPSAALDLSMLKRLPLATGPSLTEVILEERRQSR